MVSKWFKLIRLQLNGLSVTPSTLFCPLCPTPSLHMIFFPFLLSCSVPFSPSLPPSLPASLPVAFLGFR